MACIIICGWKHELPECEKIYLEVLQVAAKYGLQVAPKSGLRLTNNIKHNLQNLFRWFCQVREDLSVVRGRSLAWVEMREVVIDALMGTDVTAAECYANLMNKELAAYIDKFCQAVCVKYIPEPNEGWVAAREKKKRWQHTLTPGPDMRAWSVGAGGGRSLRSSSCAAGEEAVGPSGSSSAAGKADDEDDAGEEAVGPSGSSSSAGKEAVGPSGSSSAAGKADDTEDEDEEWVSRAAAAHGVRGSSSSDDEEEGGSRVGRISNMMYDVKECLPP